MPEFLFVANTARGGSSLVIRMITATGQVNFVHELTRDLFRSLRNTMLKNSTDPELSGLDLGRSVMHDYYFSPLQQKIKDCIQNSSVDLPLEVDEWKEVNRILKNRAVYHHKELIPFIDKFYGETYRQSFLNVLNCLPRARNLDPAQYKWFGLGDAWMVEFFMPLARAFPKAKFLVIIRDPRGSISSNRVDPKNPGIAHVLSWVRSWRKLLAYTVHYLNCPEFKDRLFLITYDHFLHEPEHWARRVCEFLEVDYHPDILNTNNYFDYSEQTIWQGNSSYESTTSGISPHRAMRWKDKLSKDALKFTEFLSFPDLNLIGFEPTIYKDDPLDPKILRFVHDDSKGYKRWRNDTQLLELDFGSELFRKALLSSPENDFDIETIRKAFLFEDVFERLKQKPLSSIITLPYLI